MLSSTLEQELHRHLHDLPPTQQRQVVDFARSLSLARPQGVAGSSLLEFAGTIPLEDLTQMQAAIEADCEQVDPDEW